MQTRYLALPLLLVLTACNRQPEEADKPLAQPSSALPVQTAPGSAWQPAGRHDEFYFRFKGSQTVGGVAEISWENSSLAPAMPAEFVWFKPDEKSRKGEPILGELIDVPINPGMLAALGLPVSAPPGDGNCGYAVTATVVLGDYYKYDKPESDGFDTTEIKKVAKASKPQIVKCNPHLGKVAAMQP